VQNLEKAQPRFTYKTDAPVLGTGGQRWAALRGVGRGKGLIGEKRLFLLTVCCADAMPSG